MKKVIMLMLSMIIALGLIGCGDGEISSSDYQSAISGIGIVGIDEVVEGVSLSNAFKSKVDTDNSPTHKEVIELYGDKENIYNCSYYLGTDEEQAKGYREEYVNYLTEQGYEWVSDLDGVSFNTYVKGTNVVLVMEDIIGPVNWEEDVQGQYGLYVQFYE